MGWLGRERLNVARDSRCSRLRSTLASSLRPSADSGRARENACLRHDRMERHDERNAAPVRLARAAERGGRDDAHVRMHDVGRSAAIASPSARTPPRVTRNPKPRRARRVDAHHTRCRRRRRTRRWRDDDHVVSRVRESRREILQMQLDAADARTKPVADERDLHRSFRRSDVRGGFLRRSSRATRSNAPARARSARRVCSADIDTRMRQAFARHRGRNDRVREHAVVEQRAPGVHRANRVADEHGNDRRLRRADVEAERAQPVGDALRVLPEPLAPLRLLAASRRARRARRPPTPAACSR